MYIIIRLQPDSWAAAAAAATAVAAAAVIREQREQERQHWQCQRESGWALEAESGNELGMQPLDDFAADAIKHSV